MWYFHATEQKNLESILSSGLKPNSHLKHFTEAFSEEEKVGSPRIYLGKTTDVCLALILQMQEITPEAWCIVQVWLNSKLEKGLKPDPAFPGEEAFYLENIELEADRVSLFSDWILTA